mgnify:CR=1 FL=1
MSAESVDEPGKSDSSDHSDRKREIGADTVGGDVEEHPVWAECHNEKDEDPGEYQADGKGTAESGGDEDEADDAEGETGSP